MRCAILTDGAGHVVRVDTETKLGDPQFTSSTAAVFSAKSGNWKQSASIMDKLLFSGDWYSCTEDQANELIAATVRQGDLTGKFEAERLRA